jgi:hypothetical protein
LNADPSRLLTFSRFLCLSCFVYYL